MVTVLVAEGSDSEESSSDGEESGKDEDDAAANLAVGYHVNAIRAEMYMGIPD